MLDNICSLPLTSEIFAQTLHPHEPVLTVGLSGGNVQTYRLPPGLRGGESHNGTELTKIGNSRRHGSSESGFDIVDTVWKTKRHKGSCRAIAYTGDGKLLISAGIDEIVKTADAHTGQVVSKIRVPAEESGNAPSVLHTLSPQAVILGTDGGSCLVYDLRQPHSHPAERPSQSLRPHSTKEDPAIAEAIVSLTSLSPNASSTSGTRRSWVTTSGSTLAVSDLRKGVVTVSEDQGDVLTSSTSITPSSKAAKKRGGNGLAGSSETILVGAASGVLTIWERGMWTDQQGRIIAHRDAGGLSDEGSIDAIAAVPENLELRGEPAGRGLAAVGLGNGAIRFVRLQGHGGKVIGEIFHDELTLEGVTTLDFDAYGRMISGGGQIIKVWHEKNEPNAETDDEDMSADEPDSEVEDDSEEEVERQKPLKKKRQDDKVDSKHGHHGVMAFSDLD